MKCLRNVAFVAVALSVATAYGWGPTSHEKAALNALNYPTVAPSLAALGLSAGTIAGMADELDLSSWRDTYHSPGWETMRDRLWLTDPKWNNLDESRKLAFLCHIACDSGVPLGHSPANQVWSNTTIEAALEARVETWGSFPGITPYTGSYTDKMNAFYSQEISLANWAKSNLKWYNVATGSAGKTAGWSGLTYGQNLCEAMLVEYFATRGGGLMMASVPEPASMSLLLMGALSLLGWRKWRRHAA